MSKKAIVFVLAAMLAICAFSMPAFAADGNVAFYDVVSGDDSYDGITPDTAKRSLGAVDGSGTASILATFGPEGGTLVLPGKGRPGSDYTFPAMEGPLTITAVWDGIDYRNYLPMDNPSSGVLKGAGSTTNPLGISITIGTDTTLTDMILFQEDEQNSIIVPAGLTLTITDSVDLMTKPGNEHYWRVVVEEGGTAVLSEEALQLLTIENSGTVLQYGDESKTPVEITAPAETTAAAPAVTTAAPAATTAAPVVTTAAPAVTTAAPVETTAAPTETTAAPVVTTATPTAPAEEGGIPVGVIIGIAAAVVIVVAVVVVVVKKKK